MDTITVLLAMALAYCIYRLHIHSQRDTLKNHVAWCASKDLHIKANLSLWDYIWNAQLDGELPEQYRLVWEERSDTNLILSSYQQELAENFFTGRMLTDKSYDRLRGQDFFMLTLRDYLLKHECDLYFGELDKYKLLSRKNYGMWGGQLYDAEYELTDFGRIYHKLLLIATYSTTQNPDGWLRKAECEVLDTNRIQISRM